MSLVSVSAANGSGPSSCEVELTRAAGTLVLAVSGELDAATVGRLEEPLLHAVASHEDAVVDLTRCEFIDSTVVATLVMAYRCSNREDSFLRLVGTLQSQPWRVLEITGLDDHLPLYSGLVEALEGKAPDERGARLPEAASG